MFKRYVFFEGLTNLLGSGNKFLINIKGQIKDNFGNDVPFRRDADGNKIVYCLGWAGERDYRVIDLVALQCKALKLPESDYDKVIAFTIDRNPDNTHAENIGYRFKGGRLEHAVYKGFYYVPGIPGIVINMAGKVFSLYTQNFVPEYVTKPNPKGNIKNGYIKFGVRFSKGPQTTCSRHRALCLVFKEFPDNVDKLTVNHINGVPGDDRLDNLEWVTRGQNNLHAYVNDLKQQHKRVLVRDVLTGEVTEYYSISECARALGWATDETVRQRLVSSKFGQVFQDGTQIKLKNDPRDWIIPDDPEKEILLNQERHPVIVGNCGTGEIREVKSMLDAEKLTGVIHSTINWRLTHDDRSPCFGFQFKHARDKRPFPSFTTEEYLESLKDSSFIVVARNVLTEEEMEFSSVNKASKYFNHKGISSSMREGKQPLLASGWQLKYKKDNWVDTMDLSQDLYCKLKEITAREEATKKVILADTSTSMADMLGLDRKLIREAALTRGNMLYKGYRFRLGVTDEPWPDTFLPSQ